MRTFIAVDLPAPLQTKLAYIQSRLQEHLRATEVPANTQKRGIRWNNPQNVHLTLRFLGTTSAQQRATLADQLTELAGRATSFQLALGELGVFPNWRRPSVIWLGLTGAVELLGRLQSEVEQTVQEAGFDPETKPFRPHLTLARLRRELPRTQQAAIGQALQEVAPGLQAQNHSSFTVTELILYRSDLQPSGAVYTPLATFSLQ